MESPGHIFDLLDMIKTKLNRYNPDAPNPEVLHSAEGNLSAASQYWEEMTSNPETTRLVVALTNHLRSLREGIAPGNVIPDARQVRDEALLALAVLRNEAVKKQGI